MYTIHTSSGMPLMNNQGQVVVYATERLAQNALDDIRTDFDNTENMTYKEVALLTSE